MDWEVLTSSRRFAMVDLVSETWVRYFFWLARKSDWGWDGREFWWWYWEVGWRWRWVTGGVGEGEG